MTCSIRSRLAEYLEELRDPELRKFKFHLEDLAPAAGWAPIPWGRTEKADSLDLAHLLVAHVGERGAWELAVHVFERIHRKDLWERARAEAVVRDLSVSALGCQWEQRRRAEHLVEPHEAEATRDPRDVYREHIRRKFRFIEDRNARPGECVNLSQRYTQLLLMERHPTPQDAAPESPTARLEAAGAPERQPGPVQVETLLEPDASWPEPPRTVVLQGAAGIGKSMLARKIMLDWAEGRLYRARFDYLFYISCREMSRVGRSSLAGLISGRWPRREAPLADIVRRPERLLFVIDGFDELGRSPRRPPPGRRAGGWKAKLPVASLLGGLLGKDLLPEASLLITTRPAGLARLQPLLEQPRHAEILGFSRAGRRDYFHKFFGDGRRAARALGLVRDVEALSAVCFVPLVCWIVCTCLKQEMERGEPPGQPSKTTTSVYVFYLLSLLQPDPGGSGPRGRPVLAPLCSLAAHGVWARKVLFDEGDLRRHGLAGSDVSAFLNLSVFQKDIHCQRLYSFIHRSFQEFFAALFYLTGGDGREGGRGSRHSVTRLLEHYGRSETSYLALTVRFLFGLLNEENKSYLERQFGCPLSPTVKGELLAWIEARAQIGGRTLERGTLDLFSCLYETQEEGFIRRALDPIQVVVARDLSTKMDHVISAFCVGNCRNASVVHLGSVEFSSEEAAEGQGPVGTEGTHLGDQPLSPVERCWLPDTYCEHLSSALRTNQNLAELVLDLNALGNQGVKLLCQGLGHANCKLQNLGLKKCRFSSAACQDISSALSANQNLVMMDLSNNALGDVGVKLLCAGLRHPKCRLQSLQLKKCYFGWAACEDLSSVLSTNPHLMELDLTGNALGDAGVQLLCVGMKQPSCRLKTLWLKICHLTRASCVELASVLSMDCSLTELDLSLNDLEDAGVRLLCEGLGQPKSKLQKLRLGICRLTSAACGAISTALGPNGHLKELDLSFNDLGDGGAHQLCGGLNHPNCKLQKLWLDSCCLTAIACESLSSVIAKHQTLTKLYLTNNALGDAGVGLLCERLNQPTCKLRTLWLFGMELKAETQNTLAALRRTKPHLDIGS
ncbi:LOW QUALITY PROTEIN: NACHT, LRR and PYD domains-containing protein 12-like [Tachyglossus aculeatus]|uniref:LOW QUALITY PROTEIN: NACHT, LRR and PYD domains-containing protein 12-like n=1 Tax=Tachyglossus aculeatus TaxID=9261 RepID=UPI0018F798E4|nr:LOW QUALITY PROTEIN: NACHT, LRR and PYD domains-containing protein 12-like [Tachyglossus aculeatus]